MRGRAWFSTVSSYQEQSLVKITLYFDNKRKSFSLSRTSSGVEEWKRQKRQTNGTEEAGGLGKDEGEIELRGIESDSCIYIEI